MHNCDVCIHAKICKWKLCVQDLVDRYTTTAAVDPPLLRISCNYYSEIPIPSQKKHTT